MVLNSRRVRFYLVAGFFLLVWSAACILLDSQLLWGIYRQTLALRYPRVAGKVMLSQVTEEPGDLPVRHAAFEFAYQVEGQRYTSDQCRYGPQKNSPAHVESLPVGADVDVYYNPDNPADACVYRGVDGSDLSELMFLTPFNVIMVIGWFALIQDWQQRRQQGWIAAALHEEDLRTRIRFEALPAPMAGMIAAGASSFLFAFIITFALRGGFRAGLDITGGAWVFIVIVSLAVTASTARRNRAGVRDVIIDDASNAVTLPPDHGRTARVTVPFEVIKAVEIERRINPRTYPGEVFFPVLIFTGLDNQIRGARLTKRFNQAEAINLTNWFRQRLRIKASQPDLLLGICRGPDSASLAESGIRKIEEAGRLHLLWNNRQVRIDNFVFLGFILFWIVWAPLTCLVTSGIFLSNDPTFCLIWCIFGWLGTLGIPYVILRRFQSEWIEVSRQGISHGFGGWLGGKLKVFPLETIVELDLGRHGEESMVTLNIRKADFPQRHILGYWLAPGLKEQVFEAIHDFRNANWLPLKMTRYGV